MSSKRNIRRRSCERKQRFASKEEATAIITVAEERRGRPVKGIGPYPCPRCGGWHIGHKPLRKQPASGVHTIGKRIA